MTENHYLVVRNLAHHASTKVARHSRVGGRYTGFLLQDGTRIRRQGRRGSTLGIDTFLANADDLILGVQEGFLEISADDSTVLSIDELRSLAKMPAPKDPVPPPVVEEDDGWMESEETPVEVAPPAAVETPKPTSLPEVPKGEKKAVTDEALRAMAWPELMSIAKEFGVNAKGVKRNDLIAQILAAGKES